MSILVAFGSAIVLIAVFIGSYRNSVDFLVAMSIALSAIVWAIIGTLYFGSGFRNVFFPLACWGSLAFLATTAVHIRAHDKNFSMAAASTAFMSFAILAFGSGMILVIISFAAGESVIGVLLTGTNIDAPLLLQTMRELGTPLGEGLFTSVVTPFVSAYLIQYEIRTYGMEEGSHSSSGSPREKVIEVDFSKETKVIRENLATLGTSISALNTSVTGTTTSLKKFGESKEIADFRKSLQEITSLVNDLNTFFTADSSRRGAA